MRLNLPSEIQVEVRVHHFDPFSQERAEVIQYWSPHRERFTFVEVIPPIELGKPLLGVARCSPQDNFIRKLGRKLAAEDLLYRLKVQGFSKADRRAIFAFVCPEFKRGEKQ